MKHFKNKSNAVSRAGFSLIEMVIYVALLVSITLLTINTILSFTGSYQNILALRSVNHSAVDVLERMTRDIRGAGSITTANSILNVSPGSLTVVATDGSNATTTRYYVDNGTLKVDVNGVLRGPLTMSDVHVDSLVFNVLTNSNSSAVKIGITMTGTSGRVSKTKSYYSTVILLGK